MGGAGGQRVAAWAALVFGVGGLVISAAGLAIQVLPRHFTAGQQQDLAAWQMGGRWRSLAAGRVFPASVGYQLPDTVVLDDPPLRLRAMRVVIAPQAPCATGVTGAGAAADLRRAGCEAMLRAVYEDETRSFVMTVGVAVLPSLSAASAVSSELSGSAGVTLADSRGSAARLVSWRLALPFGYSRQLAAVRAAGPYLVLYTAGYADGRPWVQLAHDSYAQAEISSMADGVASAVAGVLGAVPPAARCPGAPGC